VACPVFIEEALTPEMQGITGASVLEKCRPGACPEDVKAANLPMDYHSLASN